MRKIVTAGLTPAWQHVLEFEQLEVGAVNRVRQSRWFSAGKAVNAAVAIHALGGEVRALLPGGGVNRFRMLADFAELGLDARWVVTQADVRVCTTIVDHGTGNISELVENGTPFSEAELDAWHEMCRKEFASAAGVAICGSLPVGTPVETYARMMAYVSQEVPSVLDFRGVGLLKCLKYRPWVVKPNLAELEQTVGKPLRDKTSVVEACRELNRLGAHWVIVTNGPGEILLVSETDVQTFFPPEVPKEHGTLCPIGCGDALTGGLLLGLSRGDSIESSLQLGIYTALRNLFTVTSCRFDKKDNNHEEI